MQQVGCDSDSYTWDGVVYTSSSSYANTYTNAAGCDSVHTLNLTINSSDATSSGQTIHIAILRHAAGCDSYIHWDWSSTSINTYFIWFI